MVVDTGMRGALIDAGLIDPGSGAFLSEPNFGGEPESPEPRDPLPTPADDVPANEPEKPAQEQPNQEPAKQPQVTETPSAPGGDPVAAGAALAADPQKLGDQADPVRQKYEQNISQMRQQAQMAYLQGQALRDDEGNRVYTDEQLASLIGRELQHAEQQAYLAGVMERMQPVAKRAAAEKIAQAHGVDVNDILNEESPVAMETRAKTISELKRDGRFQERKNAGTDTAEGSRSYNNAVPEAIEKLSPQQKMYLGFARGDR